MQREVAIDADLKGHLLRYIHYEYTQLPNQTGTLSMDGSNPAHTDLCSHSNSTYLSGKNEFIDRCTRSVSGKPLAFLPMMRRPKAKSPHRGYQQTYAKTVAGLLLLTTLWTLFQYLSISRSMIGGSIGFITFATAVTSSMAIQSQTIFTATFQVSM